MKIGMVSPYDWRYPGGVRDHVRHLANEFMAMGHEVRMLTPASGIETNVVEQHIPTMGGTIPIPINGSIARITLHPRVGWRVRCILQRERFDVLHVHEPLIPGLPLAVLHFSRALNAGTFHAYAQPGIISPTNLAYASAWPIPASLLQSPGWAHRRSPAAYHFVSHYFEGDYRIIPNGVNLDDFNPCVDPFPAYMDGKQNILFVGRFEKRKGIKYLLRAIPAIRERFPNTRFLFVGEDRLRHGFQQRVQRHCWRDVVFTGFVSERDKPRYFASVHIFCAPAIGSESMGIVLLEAMASGKPVAATTIAGYATVVQDGLNGLLIPPRDSQALAVAIGHVLEYEPLRQRLISAGLQTAHAYAWPHIIRRALE